MSLRVVFNVEKKRSTTGFISQIYKQINNDILMELNDYFEIDSNLSFEENLDMLPCEVSNGSIFLWNYGFYTKAVLDELIQALGKYGENFLINKTKSEINHIIFTKLPENLLEIILEKKEFQHFYFFIDKKDLENHSYLEDFFFLNKNINYNLLSEELVKTLWSDVIKNSQNENSHFLNKYLVLFKKHQNEKKLNPSFLFDIKTEEDAKFIFKKIYKII